ncbi:MAG: hemin-degrading factor [Blastocatellia bacterium]|nr:hemin-degrading factor [Blastocatellia bacterium]
MSNATIGKHVDLRAAWREHLEQNPGTRIRDAASALGVSEAELLATICGESVVRLDASWPELVGAFERLGTVMTLTRNDVAVHEKTGAFENVSASGSMGLVLGEAIDLRIFFSRWHHGFAVETEAHSAIRRSFQFFDADGTAVHKVFLTDESNEATYHELVAKYRSADQSPKQPVIEAEPENGEKPDGEIDVEGFRAAWRGLQDTHEFFGMLRDFGVTRTQGLRLAPAEFARPVPVDTLQALLDDVAAAGTEIMVFVGSPGVIQIHTGPVRTIKVMGPWVNVLDPEFNLHVRADLIASAWVVRKPTADGVVTSVEFFDGEGGNVALVFGKRKPGKPELDRWREHVEGIARRL